jgi:cysteine desulfuration protein SufE
VNTLPELKKYNEFVENLELIDDEDMRFEYIIDLGKKVTGESFPEVLKVDINLMDGCMSKVWITNKFTGGLHYFSGFSDAIIVKGLVTMIVESFSGITVEQLNALNENDVRKLNLGALTTQRQVGMMAMLEHLKKLGRRQNGSTASGSD